MARSQLIRGEGSRPVPEDRAVIDARENRIDVFDPMLKTRLELGTAPRLEELDHSFPNVVLCQEEGKHTYGRDTCRYS